ncbi:PDZ domain-containing protein [Sulfobacillus harzensis]|uniref:PDZ domain-containing protein n=1 Tax=Sulfobacillus harzensis TaxID=2729629 RepID=A0A7Y0L4U2_9FIRM|nr:S16 family serine protease [Sulfobacillus harzensis]NMP22987.1 PDZ domain-containing protein [Sulfobacillus harzensis]
MRKRRVLGPVLWVVAILAIIAVVLRFVPSGQVEVSPGITGDLSQMIQVKDGHSPGPGKLLMVAVNVGTVSEFGYLVGHFNPTVEFVPEKVALGGLSMNQYIQYNNSLMSQSQWSAEVAGEKLAGLPAKVVTIPGALVVGVLKTGPAAGHLKPGDLITKIGPYPISTASATVVRKVMKNFKVGEIVNVTVKRGGQTLVIPVKLGRIKSDPDPAFGVLLAPLQKPVIPRPVTVHAKGIGGPSAGMMFALEIYDQITGRNIAHGKIVAGTGEILPNGQVEQIGGVAQKVVTVYRAGARIFVVPQANYAKAEGMAKRLHLNIKIFPVKNVQQALADIQRATS